MTGRWELTIKTDKQGNFFKAKVRWVLRGFQDKQKEHQQTDSLASTRPRFRMSCQMTVSRRWNIFHIDLKTAFLQGQSSGVNRDVVCQLPPEAGHPPHMAAWWKKHPYGMNDAPRHGWNILDKALCSYGMTRVDRCCYVLYSLQSRERTWNQNNSSTVKGYSQHLNQTACADRMRCSIWKMLVPIEGGPATGKSVAGIFNLFVGDLFGDTWNRNETTCLGQT